MSPFLRSFRMDDGPVGASRIERGPVGTNEDEPLWLLWPFVRLLSCECLHASLSPFEASRLFCASSTSFFRFSSAMRSLSAFGMNLGFAAAASLSRLAFNMSSILGGCLRAAGGGTAAVILVLRRSRFVELRRRIHANYRSHAR